VLEAELFRGTNRQTNTDINIYKNHGDVDDKTILNLRDTPSPTTGS